MWKISSCILQGEELILVSITDGVSTKETEWPRRDNESLKEFKQRVSDSIQECVRSCNSLAEKPCIDITDEMEKLRSK